ncbi:hypothetical protein H0H93_003183, partial [Arthromyces matolae]
MDTRRPPTRQLDVRERPESLRVRASHSDGRMHNQDHFARMPEESERISLEGRLGARFDDHLPTRPIHPLPPNPTT